MSLAEEVNHRLALLPQRACVPHLRCYELQRCSSFDIGPFRDRCNLMPSKFVSPKCGHVRKLEEWSATVNRSCGLTADCLVKEAQRSITDVEMSSAVVGFKPQRALQFRLDPLSLRICKHSTRFFCLQIRLPRKVSQGQNVQTNYPGTLIICSLSRSV